MESDDGIDDLFSLVAEPAVEWRAWDKLMVAARANCA